MTRQGATAGTGHPVPLPADPVAMAQMLQPVRAGGSRRPIGLAVATATILATLIWQPWGRGGSPVASPTPAPLLAAAPTSPASTPGQPAVASPAPGSSPAPDRGPRPTFHPGVPPATTSATYISLVDNEWSVVAFIAPTAQAAAAWPWTTDGSGAAPGPGGSLLVLQQGLDYSRRPLERPGKPDVACDTPGVPRSRIAVPLPADRVAYLGVTFPGMDPRARVTATVVGRSGIALRRLPTLSLLLGGMVEGQRYTVPSSGSGGAVLFALAKPQFLPVATYRFEIAAPGIAGHRFLYACVQP